MPLVALLASGCATTQPSAQIWLTTADGASKLERQADPSIGQVGDRTATIVIDPSKTYQTIEGFGASFTDSSSWLIRNKLPTSKRKALLRELFDRKNGLGFGLTRLTIGASDFSLRHYSLNDLAPGQTDPLMQHFSIEKGEPAVLELATQARQINPQLKIFASPWSAPGWMKDNGSLIKGTLRTESYPAFAEYLARYAEAMRDRGLPIYGLSIQNEPHFQPDNYPGMYLSPAQRAEFIGKHLGPVFAQRGLTTKIYDWDHNWDQPASPLEVLSDPAASRYVAGTAWHCYAGNVTAQSQVHAAFPEKETWFTECSGGGWAPAFGPTLGWMTENLIIGTTRHWAKGVILWNIALDESSGPHLGGCGNCRGVITIDSKTGTVTRNVEYYVLGHVSRFVQPGSVRIASESSSAEILSVAFRNPARGRMAGSTVLVVYNKAKDRRNIAVELAGAHTTAMLEPGSVATLVWSRQPARNSKTGR